VLQKSCRPRPETRASQAAELSVHEMRISVPSLIEKLQMYKPKLVCFVGKGIWDKFEDIVSKACREVEVPWIPVDLDGTHSVLSDDKPEIKLEDEMTSIETPASGSLVSNIKTEHGTKPSTSQTPSPLSLRRPRPNKIKEAFEWTQPRPYKLVHQSPPNQVESATLFWVVPSTSGLERTPVRTQWRSERSAYS